MARAAWPFQAQVLNETYVPYASQALYPGGTLEQVFLLSFLKSRAERGEELLELVGFPSDTQTPASVKLVPRGLSKPLAYYVPKVPLAMQARWA